MKEFGRRALALALRCCCWDCALAAKTEPAQEETAASEAAAEPAQPEKAPATEEPTKDEAADAAIDEQPETVESKRARKRRRNPRCARRSTSCRSRKRLR